MFWTQHEIIKSKKSCSSVYLLIIHNENINNHPLNVPTFTFLQFVYWGKYQGHKFCFFSPSMHSEFSHYLFIVNSLFAKYFFVLVTLGVFLLIIIYSSHVFLFMILSTSSFSSITLLLSVSAHSLFFIPIFLYSPL